MSTTLEIEPALDKLKQNILDQKLLKALFDDLNVSRANFANRINE